MSYAGVDWAALRSPGRGDWRSRFGGKEWRFDSSGVHLRDRPEPLRTRGRPVTCATAVELYGAEIAEASAEFEIPPELIVMTIATEAGRLRDAGFTGPGSFRWEPHISDYSAGPMQLLGSTARALLDKVRLPRGLAKPEIPRYTVRPALPDMHPLYDARLSIWLGASYIASQAAAYSPEFDPILIAASYNAGSLRQSTNNPWGLVSTGDHLDRAGERYGDACAVLQALRSATPSEAGLAKLVGPSGQTDYFELYSLTREQAEREKELFLAMGADVTWDDEEDDLVTLTVDLTGVDQTTPSAGAGAPAAAIAPPGRNDFVICVERQRTEGRAGKSYARTIGAYQAFFKKKAVPGLGGVCAERQGPGDNSAKGVKGKRRVAAGEYPLATHVGPRNRFLTLHYDRTVSPKSRLWPALRLESTKSRGGILIHPGLGFLSSEGCLNLCSPLQNGDQNIVFADSWGRVVALIDWMRANLDFPNRNGLPIPNAWIEIRGEP